MKKLDPVSGGRLRFHVRLSPRASRNAVAGWTGDGVLKVAITAPPVDDAANIELMRFLARLLGARKSEVMIVSGHHSRKKRIEVPDSCKNRLLSFGDI